MDMKSGHKKTDLGVFPEEWQLVPLDNVLTEFRGGAPLKPSDFTSSGVKVLPKGGVGRTGWLHVEDADIQYCSAEYATNHFRNQVDETFTIVVLRDLVPSGPSIGQMVQIRGNETFVLAQGVYGYKVNCRAVPGYLVQLSNTRWYRKQVNTIMVGSTQVHITNTAFKRLHVPLPPPNEQEAIAEALSDTDALIESLEQLIAKKQHIKQGTMQELLTCKKRLPGFSGEWDVMTFGDVFQITAGGDVDPTRTISYQNQTHCYPIYSNALTDFGLYGYCSYADHQAGTITVTARGTLGFANYRDHAYTAIGRVLVLHPKQESDGRFLAEVINNRVKFAIESTGVPQLTAPQISAYSLTIPPPQEQTAIASILSAMDAEITSLETKLTKIRQLKQGMMHNLLTGRIRLI